MTQFVSHIPVDIAAGACRSPRLRHYEFPPPHLHHPHHHHHHHHHKKFSRGGDVPPSPCCEEMALIASTCGEVGTSATLCVHADGNASFLRAARSGNLEKVIEFLKGSIDINTSNANGLNALHLAAKEGHVNVVTELLKRGANVNAATKKGNTALHIASLAGQEEVVKVLIQLGANVNVQSQNGFTPLYMAAQENHDAVVSFLLASGANQSLATEDGFAPLAVALQQGHDKVVAVLLENDTKGKVRLPALHIAAKKDDCKAATLLLQSDHNPDVTSKSGFTPLHIAAHYGNENIAKILLNKGADVNYAAKHQITPLHVASKWGKQNMVVLLLQKGANIDAATRDGLTPLHCAARSGHDTVVDLLLEKGAPFLAKTKNGLAPLHMASQGDHVDSARILLFHKAPVDDVTVDYLTALHVAAHCGHVKVAKLLLDRKADANARALNGFTPLHIACKKNRIKVVELLLKHGASIEATTESGLTPLHVASFMGCMNIVIYLIQNGANPDVPTVRGETPLHLAARANQTDIIRILLRNGASVDARAREEQTPLHIAARLGNVDIVSLLLQHGAAVDAVTKDMYTALHITAKEDQEEVAAALLDHGASLTATTKKGFTPLHLAAKYGNIKVARLLLQKGAPVDAQGKNGVTPLHVAAHYDHVNVALLLLDKGASPHAMAKNGYTPLHIAAKKNQMDIASTLLEYGANTNSESKAGFTPLHLASQEGHADMSSLLIENKANVNQKANNGLTPLHLCAQDDRVNVAQVLVKNGAEICPQTKAGYTPLHVASHFGQINMVRFLLQNDANVHTVTSHGYTPLHQAAQQGHTLVVNLLLESQASPNVTTVQGQTPLSIAQRLGYISVVETLKVVTETTVTTTTTTVTEEKYKVVAPETMQETFMTDSEDEGGEEAMLGDQSYRYLTADEMKSLGDDSLPIDVTKDEKQQDAMQAVKQFGAPMVEEDNLSPQHATPVESGFSEKFSPDNVDLAKVPVHAGSRLKWKTFLVSFMVDARGGAMRGCRHSGVRVIIPPRKASMPMRITCRYLRKEKLIHPPPLMEGEACASRILEMGPVGAGFLGPVIIEVPHFASTRGKEREITILRSDTGESWREHTLEASEEAVQEVLNESFEGEELSALEDLNTNRITRILTTDFPQYFAIVTRIRQEVHGVGPEGGMVSSTVVPQVQAIFPEGALTKKIRVGLQAQPIAPELVVKLLGNRVAVSPIVTVEPRRRKFHKPITLTIPVPQAATKGMINQYNKDAPTLRLLCSITGSTKSGGSSKAQWEDVTGSTPFTFVNDCVSFTTTVSARFWLMDCRQVNEVTRFATELYQEAVYVPFMSKFVIFAKRHDPFEAQLRVFCMTDDKEDKTLETQEHFTEVAKSRDVEVLEGKLQYLEFAGNLVPVTKSGEQLKLTFQAFHENRLPFTIRVKDPHVEAMGRIAFMKEPKAARGEPSQTPICNLNVALPEVTMTEANADVLELVKLEKSYDFMQEAGLSKPELIHRADLRLSDIARELDKDWVLLAQQLDIPEQDVEHIKAQTVCDQSEQARMMLRLWLQKSGSKATGNELEKGLRKINREDIINNCMFNVELVTDDVEKAVAKVHLDQSGFDVFKEELGSSREASMRRGASLDVSYTDEQDIMKEAESAAETSSETGSLFERDQLSQALTDDKDAKIRRASKTPPPSPIDESVDKGGIEIEKLKEISALLPEIKDSEDKKPIETEFKTVEITSKVGENVIMTTVVQEIPAKLTESETWPSGDLDTSQVSVSSLPDDEKTEPTTATVSSTAAITVDITKRTVPDTEPDEDLEEETLSPIKFKEDLCSKKVSPTKSIFESKMFLSQKITSSVQLTPEKILCLQELPLSPVKEVSEIETKEMCTSPCSDKLETVKPNQLISTRKGFRTRKRLSPIHDGNKIEQKLPSRVDRGLSPIAVLTAGPSGIEQEGSEYFVQTYDAPAMQEPMPSSTMFCSKSTEMSPKSIFENKDISKISVKNDLVSKEVAATSIINEQHKRTVSVELTKTSKFVVSQLADEKEVAKSPDVKPVVDVAMKIEKSTSPLSDIMLDTGIGTDSPITADTASSPFLPDTLSPSSLSIQSSAQLLKENSSTQTIHVEMLSAHTSPIDGPFSLQESNISCCGTESSLKSDSLDDISRTLGTPSSDNVDVGLELNYSLPQSFSKDGARSTVKEFLEEHTVSDNASDVIEAEDVSTSSSHEIVLKSDLPGYTEDREAVDKMLVIESFRNVFATEPPFSVVASQQRASPKKYTEYGKKRKGLVLSEASSEDKIFSLHDQLLSEESALESSTDSGVDLKESSQGFITYTTTVHTTMHFENQDLKKIADDHVKEVYPVEKAEKTAISDKILSYKEPVDIIGDYIASDKTENLTQDVDKLSEICVKEKSTHVFKGLQRTDVMESEWMSGLESETGISVKSETEEIVPEYVRKVEEEVLRSSAMHISESPVKETSTVYMQDIFKASPKDFKVEEKFDSKLPVEDFSPKPVEEKPIIPVKASLSFDKDVKPEDGQSKKSDDVKVEEKVGIITCIKEQFSPVLEFEVTYMQKLVEPTGGKVVTTSTTTEFAEEKPVASDQTDSLDNESPATSIEGTAVVEKDKEVQDRASIETSDFVKKVEKEILSAQAIVECISPVTDVSTMYAQEIFEPSFSSTITSVPVKSDEPSIDSKPVEEKPIVPVKASLSFDSDVAQVKKTAILLSETESKIKDEPIESEEEQAATYISDKETFSDAVDRIFSTVEIDSEDARKKSFDGKVFVAEATVIKDKRDSLYFSDPQKLSPKLEQSTSTDTTVEEITEVDKSGTTTHIIQKTTHMTLITHMKSDDTIEGDLQGVIPVDSKMDQESSPYSPELSFAEKRDFFQKLSLSSSSPSVTPTHTSKTNVETEIKLLPVTDNVINIEGSPEEQLSFVERVKFFETSSEIHTVQTVQTIMPEIKEIKKEVWTVSENELSEPRSSVYTDDVLEKEREIETIEVLEETSRISIDGREEVSSPLYTGKEVLETIFDTNKDAKVEVMVKKLSPGSEMIEICSVENISKPESETLLEAIDASDKTNSGQLIEKDVVKETIETAMDVTTEKVLADTDKSETDEEFITKTFRSVTETSYEVSKSTIDAFKKGVNDKLENKWQRESPDNISIVKETMEPSLGKSEIFICTEETLDNVKKILSVADAESNVIVSGSETLVAEEPQEEEIAKELQSMVEHAKSDGIEIKEKQIDEIVAEVPLEHSEIKLGSTAALPEVSSTVMNKSEDICESVETKHISLTSVIGTCVDIPSPEKTFTDKIETTDISFSKQSEIEEIHEEVPSYSGSNGDKSDSGASSVKDRSIEIEFLPVLEVSDDVKMSVDKTGHEALGTPCSFHKEMSIESQHSELEQSFENRQSDSSSGKKIPLTSFAAVEKAEYEEVEKEKKDDIKDIIYRESVTYEKRGKELVQSVEVTQFTEHSTEVFNVSSEKLREKFSSKKIHIDTSAEEKDSKGSVPKKLNQFLDSVTQLSDLALPSDVAPVHKRTEEWLDQSGDLMLKEGAIIEGVDNGLYEDRPPTLDDEQHRRSSPTAESFDDKARVEQCDTDVMMQLLDFVSRNDIEMAEVRTEDEAPDIEEDVSPSGEEEICSRLTYEDGKIEEKIPEIEEKSDDYLKVAESENLLHSPLRSSFDSVTSPSKRDLSLDNVETVVEAKQSIEDGLKHVETSQQIHPQSSLEVEVGSLNSDEFGYNDEKEIVPLSFVEEEDSAKPELFPSTEEKITNLEDVQQYTKEIAVTSIVIDSSSRLASDVSEGLKEVTSLEEKGPVQTETTSKSLDSPVSDLDVPLQVPTEHVQQMPSETLVSETDMADKEEIVKTKDVYLSEKEIHAVTDTQYIEKSDSAFVPCAFVNTAFAGAEVIDEVEQASPIRARSPYEVIRGEADSKTFDFPSEEEREVSSGVERVSFVTRHVEMRRRPILQHIPSEISEEDLVEREIASPVEKEELESFDRPMSVESKIYETEPTVKVVKTVTTRRVTSYSGDDGAREIAEPPEDSGMEIPSEMKQEIETFDLPTRVESLVSEDESSGIKVIKTITTTRVLRSGDYDDAGQMPVPEMLQGDKIPQSEIEALESAEIPSDVDKIVSEDEQSGIRVVKTITTTRVLRSSGDYDENADQITESQEQFITKMSSDLKDEMQSFDIPAKVETISGDTLSGIKVVKTITTTRIIGDSGDYDDKIGETSETQELVESKISPSMIEEIKSLDTPAKVETEVLEDDSSGIKVVKTITTTRVIRSSENYDDSTDLSTEFQEILDSKMPPDEIKIKSEISEYAAKTDDITTPESDTGIPTSPFELISECELTDGDHKSSTFPLSQSYPKSEKDEKSHDSVITTHSQSVTEKTISVSIASTKDYSDSSTLNEMIDQGESKVASQSMVPTTTGAIESKPLTNGPGEVEYHAEYDYDDEADKKYAFENISYSGGSAGEPPEIGETKKCHYSNVSDDVIDSEIRDILDSDQQLEDIIERPVTPEPPKDDGVNIGFIGRNLKRPSGEAIEGLISDTGFAYSDDAAALSPTSPDSKSGFAYGMQFEKYVLDQAEEAMDVDSDQYSEEKEPYNYGMRFERDPDLEDEDIPCYGDLYTHEEEDEDAIENGEKVKVVQKPVKDSDFDILAGRKYFTKNIEIDELSMSSLQEFERLEAEIVSGRKSSIGSVDSLNGKQTISKSGEHDDVSMSSLTEFERIEKECTEGEKIDPSMQESITQLSEIEEGHESQASEASQENKEDGKEEDVSIIEDYNNELENIEEIILKAENEKTDELPFQFMMKQSQKIEQITDGIELTYRDDRLTDSKIVDPCKQKGIKTSVVTEVTKVSSWTTSKSLESSLADAKDDLDQDSLRDEVSLKPDSLIDDGRQDFQDSLHEERFDDADSLQEEMRDSLFEERHIEDDSLHEMDIMPDESSLSLESSLPAVASLDSSKADDVVKVQVTDLKEPKDTQEIVGTTIEAFHLDGKTQINITDLQRGVDVMQSSTDSLEQSSSGALAAFHVESESLMSSSLNSAITSEDYTMISSTDTLEQDGRITYRYEDIPVDDIEMLVRSGQRVIVDSEGNIQAHYDGKHFIETDEITNACLTKDITEVKLPPTSSVQVHSALTTVKYVNGDQGQQKSNVFHSTSEKGEDYTSFESSHFDPDVEVEEIETTDEFGNTKIIRKIKKVTRTKAQFSSSSSSKDVEEKLKEFLREHAAGEDAGTAKEEIEEERKVDDKGNVVVIRTVKQQVLTDPEVHSKKFTGPNAAQQSQEYVETFQSLDPTEDVSEYEKVDEQGNVIRVTQKFVVTPQVHTVSFSGPDAHKQMEEYMKQWTLQSQNVGEFEGDQQRTIFPAIQMSRSSEQSEASIPTDTSETLVQKVIGDTVVTKTVLSTSSEKLVKPESSTITSISLETEKVKPSDSIEDKTSAMPK